jgi:hypothetical protein
LDDTRQIRLDKFVADGADPHEARWSIGSLAGQARPDQLPGGLLFRLRDAIFNIQLHGVNLGQTESLVQHSLPVAGHKHPGAAQLVAHSGDLSQ